MKDNERVTTNKNEVNKATGAAEATAFFKNDYGNFYFTDEAFDKRKEAASRSTVASNLDPAVIYAYNNHATYQRDYVYYGILPPPTSGPFRPNYSEFIRSFKVDNLSSFNSIYDDYSDGAFEFHFNIYFVEDKTQLKSILKVFTCYTSDLFVVNQSNQVTDIKEYALPSPIEILPWDLKKYGDTWKFVVSEFDPSSTTTYTTEISSTFGSNFNNNVKDGVGFGSSSTNAFKQSISFQITSTSDVLGEGIQSYFTPIIQATFTPPPMPFKNPVTTYYTYDVSTGIVRFSVEPKKVY